MIGCCTPALSATHPPHPWQGYAAAHMLPPCKSIYAFVPNAGARCILPSECRAAAAVASAAYPTTARNALSVLEAPVRRVGAAWGGQGTTQGSTLATPASVWRLHVQCSRMCHAAQRTEKRRLLAHPPIVSVCLAVEKLCRWKPSCYPEIAAHVRTETTMGAPRPAPSTGS